MIPQPGFTAPPQLQYLARLIQRCEAQPPVVGSALTLEMAGWCNVGDMSVSFQDITPGPSYFALSVTFKKKCVVIGNFCGQVASFDYPPVELADRLIEEIYRALVWYFLPTDRQARLQTTLPDTSAPPTKQIEP